MPIPTLFLIKVERVFHGGETDTWLFLDREEARHRCADLIIEELDAQHNCHIHEEARNAHERADYMDVIAKWYCLEHLYYTKISIDRIELTRAKDEIARVRDIETEIVHSAVTMPLSATCLGFAACGMSFVFEGGRAPAMFIAYVPRRSQSTVTCMACAGTVDNA